jgi:putative ABC transport system permease protein
MTDLRRPTWPERAYRWLLTLLPADFRHEFGESMARDFRDRDRELSGGARRRLWSRELPGLFWTAFVQYRAGAWRDVRFTLRMMARSPGFTAAAVIMLAIGTGANAAMFSVIDAVMLRSALPDAGRIVQIEEQSPGTPARSAVPFSHLDALAALPTFEYVAGMTGSLPIVTGAGAPHRLDVECVSASMFPLLGVQPILGRPLGPDDDRAGAPPVIVIGHRTWMRDFHGAPDVVGQTLTLNGRANTIVGVMPAGFLGPNSSNKIEAWAALMPAVGVQSASGCELRRASDDPTRIAERIEVVGRVRAPRTLDSAMAEIKGIGIAARLPMPPNGVQPSSIVLERADSSQFERVRAPFLALLGAVGCVLLIACANVANLQLERLVGRRREMAVRLALGATRGRIVRQTLVENLIVSLIGAACGVVAAKLTLQTIVAMIPANVPHVGEIVMDARTLAVTFAAAVVTGLAVGVVPAIQATRGDVAVDLHESSTRVIGGAQWLRRGLVVTEVALSVALVIAAALLLRTFLTLRPIDPGFASTDRLSVEILFDGDWKPNPERESFVHALMQSVRDIPGITSVSASSYRPLSGYTDLARITVSNVSADVWSSWITPHYMQDMAMTIVGGRSFNDTDSASGPPVAMINEALAARFWPGANPVGQLIDVQAPDRTITKRQIVGIVHTTRSWGTDREERSELYVPYAQEPGSTLMYFLVRTAGPPALDLPAQITSRVTTLRPNQSVERIEPIDASLNRSVAQPRFAAWLFGAFAAMAVGLAALGLSAVIAWWVTQRRREIGVRMALGATAQAVSTLILKQAMSLAGAGVALGLVIAALSTRSIGVWLYGVAPLDPATFAVVSIAMLLIAMIAAWLPARRAARIDPIITLRAD